MTGLTYPVYDQYDASGITLTSLSNIIDSLGFLSSACGIKSNAAGETYLSGL